MQRALTIVAALGGAAVVAFGLNGLASSVATSPSVVQREAAPQLQAERWQPPAPTATDAAVAAVRATESQDVELLEPIAFHNMTLVPLRADAKGPFQHYTLLEEGVAKGSLAIRELAGNSGEAQVSSVEVKNTGHKPVYLLGGEMILGGKQDRILQSDAILQPDDAWVQVPVFCVEQGRWNGRDMEFKAGAAMVHGKIKKAALSKSQGEVWSAVRESNGLNGTSSSSETFRRTVQDAKVRERVAKHRVELASKLPKGRVSGFIFAVNGQVKTADVFRNPVLLDSLMEKLLSSYILGALEEQVDPNAKPLTKGGARAWSDRAKKAKATYGEKNGTAVTNGLNIDGYVGSETIDQKTGKKVRETWVAD